MFAASATGISSDEPAAQAVPQRSSQLHCLWPSMKGCCVVANALRLAPYDFLLLGAKC
jgi:hypothetical protein